MITDVLLCIGSVERHPAFYSVGSALGAVRCGAFQGREGAAHLTLKVMARTPKIAVFEIASDTRFNANSVGYRTIECEVQPEGQRARLPVALIYDHLLALSGFASL